MALEADPARGAGAGRRALRPAGRRRPDGRARSSATGRRTPRGDPAPDRPRRGHLLAGLQRARRGLGPPLAHHRGAARRRRLRDPRPQDLEQPRRHRRLRPGAGPHQPRGAPQPRGSACSSSPIPRPGMDIRPIRSLTGEVYHYEVFLDEVRVPADRMLGREGEGFQALLAGLDTDRFWGRFYKAPGAHGACCASSWNTPTPRRAAERSLARDRRRAARRSPASPRRSRRLRLLFYRVGAMLETRRARAPRVRPGQGDGRRAGPEGRRLRAWICSARTVRSGPSRRAGRRSAARSSTPT